MCIRDSLSSSGAVYITGSTGVGVALVSGNGVAFLVGTSATITGTSAGSAAFGIQHGNAVLSDGQFQSSYSTIMLNGVTLGIADASLSMYHDTSGGRDRSVLQFASGATFGIDSAGSYIHINGTDKSAIVPTSQGYKALYCIESPEVWFMDFVREDEPIDSLFDEVTEDEILRGGTFISLSGVKYQQIWSHRRGHGKKRFESKTEQEFFKNEAFLRQAKV